MKLDQIKALKPKLRAKTTLQLLLDDDSFEFLIPNHAGADSVDLLFQMKNKHADHLEQQAFRSRTNKYKELLQNLGLKVSLEIFSDGTSSKFWITGTCESVFNTIESYFEKNPQLSAPQMQAKTTLQLLFDDDSFELIVPNDPRTNSVTLFFILKNKHAAPWERQSLIDRTYKHKELLQKLGFNVSIETSRDEQCSRIWITGRCPEIFNKLEEHFEKNPQLSAPRIQAKSALQLLLDDDSFDFRIPNYEGANTVDLYFPPKNKHADYHEQQAFKSRMYKFDEILKGLDLNFSYEIFTDGISAKFWIKGNCQTVLDALNRHNCNISKQNLIKAVERLKVSCSAVSAAVSKPNDSAAANTTKTITLADDKKPSKIVSSPAVASPVFTAETPSASSLKPPAPATQKTSRVTTYQPKR